MRTAMTMERSGDARRRRWRRQALTAALALGLGVATAVPARADDAEGGRSAGQMVDDATISTRIKASFVGSKDVKARDIQVETRQGVVQLSGFADSREEAEHAAEIARSTPGVKSVTNSIRMRPGARQ